MTNAPLIIRSAAIGTDLRVSDWSLTRSIAQCFSSGSFAVKIGTDIRLQDEIEILIGAADGVGVQYLAAGRVNSLGFDDGNLITVGWQSFAGIMAENDAEPNDWTYNTAREVIENVAGQFGVNVVWDFGIEPDQVPGNVVIDPGTKALAVIVDVCKANGWILLDMDGDLGVTTVGNEVYPGILARGLPPFLGGSLTAEDHRIAVVSANRQIPGEQRRGKEKIEDIDLYGEATDDHALAGTRRYIRSDKAGSVRELNYLAAVTSLLEGAGGIKYELNVAGLHAPDGELWQINRIVTVSDPARGVVAWPGLIETLTFSQTATEGQRSKMTLVPPAVYYSENPDAIEGRTGTDPFRGLNVWR